MKVKAVSLLMVFTALVSILSTYGVMQWVLVVHNVAAIKTVGVVADVTSIDWGTIEPGSNVNRTVNFKSVGNVPVTLSFNTSNWQPPQAQQYISLSWNYTGAQVKQAWTPVKFTLSVNRAVVNVTSFSFDITITGTG